MASVPEEIRSFTMDVHAMNSTATTNDDVVMTLVCAVCAALNSPDREVLKLKNMDRDNLTEEQLERWKQNIERELSKNLKTSQWRTHFDFCNQPPNAEYLYFHTTPTEQLTTMEFNLRLPTDTSMELVTEYDQVMGVLSREVHEPVDHPDLPHFDFDEHLTTPRAEAISDDRPPTPSYSFYHLPGLLDLHVGDTIQIPESKTVQYKKLKDGPTLDNNIRKRVSKCVGAFANCEGGWIIIGIEDKNYKVLGQTISEEAKDEIEACLDMCAKQKIWGINKEVPVRETHWDVYFHPLGEDKHLVEVRVNPFYGGVFQEIPKSYIFKVNDNGVKDVADMTFDNWMAAMMRQKLTEKRRSDEMRQKFEMLSTHVSGGCSVFALKNARREIQERMLTIKKGLHIWPESYHNLIRPEVAPLLNSVISALKVRFGSTKGLCVVSQCIVADIGIERPGDGRDVSCDILVFTETETPFLVTLGIPGSSDQGKRYSRTAALALEDRLTLPGGEGRFFIKPCWCDRSTDLKDIPGILESILVHRPLDQPSSYHEMHLQKLQALVDSLVIAVAAFTPQTYLYMSDLMGVQVMNLLTPSQLLALITCKENPYVCIQGYPGTGKTVVGIERAKQLRLDGAHVDEILYIISNVEMAKYVRDLTFPRNCSLHGDKICLSEAFKDVILMLKDGAMPERVKYLILDDTQNLLSSRNVPPSSVEEDIRNLTEEMRRQAVRKGPPLGLLKFKRYIVDWLKCLCIWLLGKQDSRMVIICDESQSLEKEHYYQTLREFIQESNGKTVTLNVIIRNSEEIAKFFKNFITTQCYGVLPTTAHGFKGEKPLLRYAFISPELLRETVGKYTSMGYRPSEITVIPTHRDNDLPSLERFMSTNLQMRCRENYQSICTTLRDQGLFESWEHLCQVFHIVLFFCLLTKELLISSVDGDNNSNFKINLGSPCFAGVSRPVFVQGLLSDRGRNTTPARHIVVNLFDEKWEYLCKLYKMFVLSDRTDLTEAVDILEECKVSLLHCRRKQITNLQKLYSLSEFLLGPVTVSEHIFRIIDVQHAAVNWLIIFHIVPNVHAIFATHKAPARGQYICVESLESSVGRENLVVIGVMRHEHRDELVPKYAVALASRARTRLEIFRLKQYALETVETDRQKKIQAYYVDDDV